jgi:hypothetical protein
MRLYLRQLSIKTFSINPIALQFRSLPHLRYLASSFAPSARCEDMVLMTMCQTKGSHHRVPGCFLLNKQSEGF